MFTVNSKPLPQIAYGAMVLEGFYGACDEDAAVATLTHAIARNLMLDTADFYGAGHNERLISRALQASGEEAFVATKFGIVFEEGQTGNSFDTGWGFPLTLNGSPEYVARAVDNSLQRLGVERIDLLYAHFPDPGTPIEDTVGAMAEAVAAGKVAALGLSNVTAAQIARAHEVHPIAAVQYEYSLFRREAEEAILPAVRSIGARLVCWSPLGAGFLTGTVSELPEGDFRNANPKLQGDNLTANLQRLEGIKAFAAELDITPAQLALAWLIAQGDDIMPIPGSRKVARIDENLAALDIKLDAEELARLDNLAPRGAFKGGALI